jgi:hypothetical protein
VLSGTLVISLVGFIEPSLTGPHFPVDEINTNPKPIEIEKMNITNNIFRFRCIL